MENLSFVKTDGSRIEPQFRLGEKNVSVQVRSLLRAGIVELQGGFVVAVVRPAADAPIGPNIEAAVSAMREFLASDPKS